MVPHLACKVTAKTVLASIVLIGAGFFLGVMYFGVRSSDTSTLTPSAREALLFQKTLPYGNTHAGRREAASRLAKNYPASSFIVWSLMADDPFLRGSNLDDKAKEIDRPVIAAILEGLPDSTPKQVLLAVTYQLNDSEQGWYSKKTDYVIMTRIADYVTPPIQELALDVLRRETGHDYGFDAERWREKIIELWKTFTDAEGE